MSHRTRLTLLSLVAVALCACSGDGTTTETVDAGVDEGDATECETGEQWPSEYLGTACGYECWVTPYYCIDGAWVPSDEHCDVVCDDTGISDADTGDLDTTPDDTTDDVDDADTAPDVDDTGDGDTETDTGDADTGATDTGEADTGEADTGEADTGEADTGEPDTDTGETTPDPTFPIAPGEQEGTLISGGIERHFRVYIPDALDSGAQMPLVFVLHGGGGDGRLLARTLGFVALGRTHNAIVVAPDGIENNWADARGTTDASLAGVDDVAFFDELITHLAAALPVDTTRVWVTGASNGGLMAQTLGCDLSHRIAAIAPVIASFPADYVEGCAPTHPMPALLVHGTEDPFMTFDGGDAAHDTLGLGDGGAILSVADTDARWAHLASCEAEPTVELLEPVDAADPTRVTLSRWVTCDDGVEVHAYVIDGMGHTWPPFEAQLPRVSGPSSPNLDATAVIWSFFQSSPPRE